MDEKVCLSLYQRDFSELDDLFCQFTFPQNVFRVVNLHFSLYVIHSFFFDVVTFKKVFVNVMNEELM